VKPGCVLDASVVVKWWFKDEQVALAAAAQSFLSAYSADELDIFAPDILLAEVGNVLWKATRLRNWPQIAARQAISDLSALAISTYPTKTLLPNALELAITHGITVYDALYVALAQQKKIPLYTADLRLVRALDDAILEIQELTAVS
jgi:predicted nucleic acid-binding protein